MEKLNIERLSEIAKTDESYTKCIKVWDYSNLDEILDVIYELGLTGIDKGEIVNYLNKLKLTKQIGKWKDGVMQFLLILRSYKAYCGICGKETEHRGFTCKECGR